MGRWTFSDHTGRYCADEAVRRAALAIGRRNLFHDDLMFQLEDAERPTSFHPVVAERRFVLRVIPNDWSSAATADAWPSWTSDPMPVLHQKKRTVRPRRVNEAVLRITAEQFFARVHDELHGVAYDELQGAAQAEPEELPAIEVPA
jgi:hypothetical protein